MVADALTKHIPKERSLFQLCRDGKIRLKFDREDGEKAKKNLKKAQLESKEGDTAAADVVGGSL